MAITEMAETISGTHCTYPRRDGQAEWAWVAWINTGMANSSKDVSNSSTNRNRRSLTSLMRRTPLLLMSLLRRILAEVNAECGQGYVSSSSDGEDATGPSTSKSQSRWPQLKLQSSLDESEYSVSAVRDTFAPKSATESQLSKPPLLGPQLAGETFLFSFVFCFSGFLFLVYRPTPNKFSLRL